MTIVYPRTAAVVGAGASGLLHALAYRARGVSIEGVFDVDVDRARDLASLVGARRVMRTLDDVAASDASCISVCSPPRHHVAQASACARMGRAVFVEKPVALTEPELATLAAAPGIVPIVQWRRGRAMRAIRHAARQGAFGPRPSVAIDLAWHRDAAYFEAGRGSIGAWGCGALLSIGVHALDAVCFALGMRIASIVGAMQLAPGRDVETTAALALRFDGGALGTLRLSLDAGDDRTTIALAGGGVTATIAGGEADPTAGAVAWNVIDHAKRRHLEALERATDGDVAGPLIVPFMSAAIDALRRGEAPGDSDALPSIADVAPGHEAAIRAQALTEPKVRR